MTFFFFFFAWKWYRAYWSKFEGFTTNHTHTHTPLFTRPEIDQYQLFVLILDAFLFYKLTCGAINKPSNHHTIRSPWYFTSRINNKQQKQILISLQGLVIWILVHNYVRFCSSISSMYSMSFLLSPLPWVSACLRITFSILSICRSSFHIFKPS